MGLIVQMRSIVVLAATVGVSLGFSQGIDRVDRSDLRDLTDIETATIRGAGTVIHAENKARFGYKCDAPLCCYRGVVFMMEISDLTEMKFTLDVFCDASKPLCGTFDRYENMLCSSST